MAGTSVPANLSEVYMHKDAHWFRYLLAYILVVWWLFAASFLPAQTIRGSATWKPVASTNERPFLQLSSGITTELAVVARRLPDGSDIVYQGADLNHLQASLQFYGDFPYNLSLFHFVLNVNSKVSNLAQGTVRIIGRPFLSQVQGPLYGEADTPTVASSVVWYVDYVVSDGLGKKTPVRLQITKYVGRYITPEGLDYYGPLTLVYVIVPSLAPYGFGFLYTE